MRAEAVAKYTCDSSIPVNGMESLAHSTPIVPLPMNGSSTESGLNRRSNSAYSFGGLGQGWPPVSRCPWDGNDAVIVSLYEHHAPPFVQRSHGSDSQ